MSNSPISDVRTRLFAAGFILTLATALFPAGAGAGPLNPPAGAVTSTAKPLSEVEPRIAVNATNTPGTATGLFRISAPGSYYLTGNITGVVGKHGIEIASSGVTLDLNGFELVGVAGMGAFDGVSSAAGAVSNIKVRNGSVRGWGSEGVDLSGIPTTGCSVSSVRASGNAGTGIRVGNESLLTDCTSVSNSGLGLVSAVGCTISGCISSSNGSIGISAGSGCTITATTVHGNSSTGIITGLSNTISNCTVYDNVGHGISTSNAANISDCTVYSNGINGILVGAACSVNRCTVRVNTSDGINCSSLSLITNNLVTANGSGVAGTGNIHVTSNDNRIEGNNVSGGNAGLLVDVASNVIVRNSASANITNWVIAANNVIGPIVDRTAPGSAAVSGNSAPSSLGTTDANANFTY